MKTQIGELVTVDLVESTLTFKIDAMGFHAGAGTYAIVPIGEYNKLVNTVDLEEGNKTESVNLICPICNPESKHP